ncbi:unnamed protein product [Caenorhabditis auriculariae]|uniref:Uncharacterized protein n=1 Tax=Caenorhabditis auriculariae TaxID=2777116 RepID=A0A8S1H8Q0_9PELO|nr:unnamed protein product [Caenorhabditis auriculariae]
MIRAPHSRRIRQKKKRFARSFFVTNFFIKPNALLENCIVKKFLIFLYICSLFGLSVPGPMEKAVCVSSHEERSTLSVCTLAPTPFGDERRRRRVRPRLIPCRKPLCFLIYMSRASPDQLPDFQFPIRDSHSVIPSGSQDAYRPVAFQEI